MHKLQELINKMNEEAKIESGKEYNLGDLIRDLEPYKEKHLPVEFEDGTKPTEFGSWRGSYCELMLEYSRGGSIDTYDFYRKAFNTNGSMFTGYKGGDFVMDLATPMHKDIYGCSNGDKIIGVKEENGKIIIITRPEED